MAGDLRQVALFFHAKPCACPTGPCCLGPGSVDGGLSLPWEPSEVEVRGQAGLGKTLAGFRSAASFRCQDGAPRCLDIKAGGAGGDWPWGCPEFRSEERRD